MSIHGYKNYIETNGIKQPKEESLESEKTSAELMEEIKAHIKTREEVLAEAREETEARRPKYKIVDGKRYPIPGHEFSKNIPVQPYNGEDMQKVAPKEKSRAYFEAVEQQQRAEESGTHVTYLKDGVVYENSLQFMNRSVPKAVKDRYVIQENEPEQERNM